MANNPGTEAGGKDSATSEAEAQAAMKRKLARRMAFAVLMVAVLLGVLAIFDQMTRPEPPPPPPRELVPVPRQEITKPLTPAVPETAPQAEDGKPAEAETSRPAVEPPPKPEVAAQPSAAPPQAQRPPPVSPGEGKSPAKTPAPIAESSSAPIAAPITQAPSAPPATRPTVPIPPFPPRAFSGYILQAGVFNNVQRAEELHAKLTLAGIASTIEARVSVGPFKTRQEADATREKLKAIGVESVLIPPPRGVRR